MLDQVNRSGTPFLCLVSHCSGSSNSILAAGNAGLPRIKSAIFSATMITGALILPLGSVGNTEASIMRKFLMPCTRHSAYNHAHWIAFLPHFTRTCGVIGALHIVLHPLIYVCVARNIDSRLNFVSSVAVHRRLIDNFSRQSNALPPRLSVFLLLVIVKQDARRGSGIRRSDFHASATFWLIRTDMNLKSMPRN